MDRIGARIQAGLPWAVCVLLALAAGTAAAQATAPAAAAPTAPATAQRPSAADDLEPAVNTSDTSARAAAAKPAAAPAPSPAALPVAAPAAAKGGKSGKAMDRLELDTTQITGNRELPKVLYIVPWKRSDLGDLVGKPANSLLDEVLQPVDRDVFKRENRYYRAVMPKDDAAAAPAAGAGH